MVFNISYKTLTDANALSINFDKIDGFTRVYDWTRYSVLFGAKIYNFIYSMIRYLIEIKSGIANIFYHNYVEIIIYLCNTLPLDETLTFQDVIIIFTLSFNKYKNNYYCNIFLEKCSYK